MDITTDETRVASASLQACQGQGAAARAEVLDFDDVVVVQDRAPELTGFRFPIIQGSCLHRLVVRVVDEVRCETQDLVLALEVNLRQLVGLGGSSIQCLVNCCASAADEKAT